MRPSSGIDVQVERSSIRLYHTTLNLWLSQRVDGELWVVDPVALRKLGGPDGRYVPPTFQLELEKAQALMDQIWECGLRPSEGTGSAGALAATQRHLDDMRRLVFEPPK